MINFILPNNYFYYDLNNQLINLLKGNPNLFHNKINFMGVNANFPFNIWNGGTLINDIFLNRKEIQELYYQNVEKPLVIDCSNVFISSKDVFNVKENIFLEQNHTGLNFIIISDPNFLTLLKNKFPYYSFILSPNFPSEEITDDIINNCSYVMNYYNQINNNIPKYKLIIILPMNLACYRCSNLLLCSHREQENNYNFKTISTFRTCQKNQLYELYLFDYNQFVQDGYYNFTFDDRAFPLRNYILMAHFYADFFGAGGEKEHQMIFSLLMEGYHT